MPPLKLEIFSDDTKNWIPVTTLNAGDRYGSLSDNTQGHRDVYYFGVDPIEGKAVIKKSNFGVDTEHGNTREISSIGGVSVVAALDPGEVYELTVQPDVSPIPRRVRFTHLEE